MFPCVHNVRTCLSCIESFDVVVAVVPFLLHFYLMQQKWHKWQLGLQLLLVINGRRVYVLGLLIIINGPPFFVANFAKFRGTICEIPRHYYPQVSK